jgi:hypothetical protein
LHGGVALFVTRGNIEKGDFIGTLLIVAPGNLNRISGVSDSYEIDALNNPPLINVETGNNAACQRH